MSTVVAVAHLRLNVAQAMNLKDKRRVVKGFKDRIRSGHNVSIAEVDGQDAIRSCVLGVAMIGNDRRYIEGALQKIVNAAAGHRDMLLLDSQIEWL